MVYGAVQQNGGRIEVHSELNQRHDLQDLPAGRLGNAAGGGRDSEIVSAGQGTVVVLVEDDGRVRRVADRALTTLGYEVHAFSSGRDALQALPTLCPVAQLLVTDVIMPGMNGRVLAERAASLLPDLRVLFVSGYAESFIVNRGVLKTGMEFLAKPYSIEQLARRVREVLGDLVRG